MENSEEKFRIKSTIQRINKKIKKLKNMNDNTINNDEVVKYEVVDFNLEQLVLLETSVT